MRHLRDRRRFCGRAEGAGAERRVRIPVLVLPVAIVGICLIGTSSSGAPPASDTSIPELLEELTFPRQAALPTCATSVGELPGAVAQRTKRELIVGQDDGAITIFQYDPLDQRTPSHLVQLGSGRRIDDVCSIRVLEHSTGREDILTVALQGTTITLVSHESMKPVKEASLPEPLGLYSLVAVSGTQTAYVYDARSLRELIVEHCGRAWSLSSETTIDAQLAGFRITVLPDRLLVLGDSTITEVLGPDSVSTMSLPRGCAPAIRADAWCATTDFIALGRNETDRGYLTLLEKRENGWSTSATVALPGTVNTAAAMSDTSVILGGACEADWGGVVGWLTIVTTSGDTLAQTQHPVPVALLAKMDDYVVAHGLESNLSVYDEQLRPIWDHASQLEPVAILSRDFDGSGSDDLAVVGIATQRRPRWEVDSMRVYLDRQDIFEGAQLTGVANDGTGGRYVKRQGSATLFLSNRHVLLEVLATERDDAVLSMARGRAEEAQSAAIRARAAAAALGLRATVKDLSGLLAEGRSLPRRTIGVLALVIVLLSAGLYVAARRVRSTLAVRTAVVASAALLLLAVAGWHGLGSTRWSYLLFLGAVIPAVGSLVSLGRRRLTYAAITSGAPIEELSARIMGFIHGGQGDFEAPDGPRVSDDALKNITQLAYLAREMMHSLGEPERYSTMRSVLDKSATVFKELVLPETAYLARLAGETRFMVESLEAMESAATRIRDALQAILDEGVLGEEVFAEHLHAIQSERQRLVDAAKTVRDAVVANPGCSLNAALNDVLALREAFFSSHNVTVETSMDVPRSADAVRGSRYVLFTIFENVLTNAVRAMDESVERKLVVSNRRDGHMCYVEVSDTGMGMSDEQLNSAFAEREDASSGGFGLPYSRRTLRRLGGDITARGEQGEGTTIRVTIPHWSPDVMGETDGEEK